MKLELKENMYVRTKMREFYYDYENPNKDVGHWEEEIKSVITHEQMEKMAYKVGE